MSSSRFSRFSRLLIMPFLIQLKISAAAKKAPPDPSMIQAVSTIGPGRVSCGLPMYRIARRVPPIIITMAGSVNETNIKFIRFLTTASLSPLERAFLLPLWCRRCLDLRRTVCDPETVAAAVPVLLLFVSSLIISGEWCREGGSNPHGVATGRF